MKTEPGWTSKPPEEKIQKAKAAHLPAILNKFGCDISFEGGYYLCTGYPDYRFKKSGSGYFDITIPKGIKGHINDNIDFIEKHGLCGSIPSGFAEAVDWLIQGGYAITEDDINNIPGTTAAAGTKKEWSPPVPHKDKYKALHKIYGFMRGQGISRAIVHELVKRKNVFADERLNIVFVIRDCEHNIIGHELVNWNGFYIPPTGLDGKRLDGYVPPTWEFGLDPYNLKPPSK